MVVSISCQHDPQTRQYSSLDDLLVLESRHRRGLVNNIKILEVYRFLISRGKISYIINTVHCAPGSMDRLCQSQNLYFLSIGADSGGALRLEHP